MVWSGRIVAETAIDSVEMAAAAPNRHESVTLYCLSSPSEAGKMRSITKIQLFGIRLAVVALVAYWTLIFTGTHLPSAANFTPEVGDKVKHFTAFAGLTFLLCYCTTSDRTWWRFGSIAVVVIVYAAIDEWTQQFVPRRVPSIYDFLADLGGMLAVGVPYLGLHLWSRKRRAARRSIPSTSNDDDRNEDSPAVASDNIDIVGLDSPVSSSKLKVDDCVNFDCDGAPSASLVRHSPAAH